MNSEEKKEPFLETKGIKKGFPGVWEHLVLDDINFDLRLGEVHTLLGENGAGKTVLANILSGFYRSTEGKIYVEGKQVDFNSPRDALNNGVGMIHQEVMLANPFTVAENVAFGTEDSLLSYKVKEVEKEITELSHKYGLAVDPKKKVRNLSAGGQQRAEILKVLYHNPQALILDEPTSLLTPQESEKLRKVLVDMTEKGMGIVFITHKMEEVMGVSDRVTVLKLGKVTGKRNIEETSQEELTRIMLGEKVPLELKRKNEPREEKVLEVSNISIKGNQGEEKVENLTFSVRKGEIFGIAGVSGNGQSELLEALTGIRDVESGNMRIRGKNSTDSSPRQIIDLGVAHMPEKRREVGVVEEMAVAENIVLRDYRNPPFSNGLFLSQEAITSHSEKMVSDFDIIAPNLWRSDTRILSGGNIQRLILGRETWRKPPLIIASHPTHGLDRKAIRNIWQLFIDLRDDGTSILLVSEDLDEVLSLSDRIGVMYEGKFTEVIRPKEKDKEEVGLLMTGA